MAEKVNSKIDAEKLAGAEKAPGAQDAFGAQEEPGAHEKSGAKASMKKHAARVQHQAIKPLALHACCGPCSLEPLRLLREEGFEPTIFWSNPNIQPQDEYDRRLDTLLTWAKENDIEVINCEADDTHQAQLRELWEKRVAPKAKKALLKTDKTLRENRCRECYALRLEESAREAAARGFKFFSTTLAVSPYQHFEVCAEEVANAAAAHGMQPVWRDFREHYPEATRRSRALGMYRQKYCGCRFSASEAALEKKARKEARQQARKQKQEQALKEAPHETRRDVFKETSQPEKPTLRTDDFDYNLPEERIAQFPAEPRDSCRLFVLHRADNTHEHKVFTDIIDYLNPGDLLVANKTRVLPARLIGKKPTEGVAETLLLNKREDLDPHGFVWEALVNPGRRLKEGAVIEYHAGGAHAPDGAPVILRATVEGYVPHNKGARLIRFSLPDSSADFASSERPADSTSSDRPANPASPDQPTILDGATTTANAKAPTTLDEAIHAIGAVPLPPYIPNYQGDPSLYQTVYAMEQEHSAAAPTAGLHFTPELLEKIKAKGVNVSFVELEVGVDTFRLVEEDDPTEHQMHTERFHVPQKVVDAVHKTKAAGGRVIAVGTTSVRSLEAAWDARAQDIVKKENATTDLFLLPGSKFHVVDAMITNFHVPRSTLMMLVSAFAGRDNIMNAYHEAIEKKYRMLSFGDAMLID